MAMSSVSEASAETGVSRAKYRVKVSRRFLAAAILVLISWLLLLISFASPYWLSSYSYTYSPFVRMGLWDFCFNNYRHPPYQYDEKFNGCHWVYSWKFQNIRDWLQPGWLIFVQAMMTMSLLASFGCLVCLSIVLMYYLVRYQVVTILTSFVLQAVSALFLFLAVLVFGIMCFDRSWLLYPAFNHLDWSYYTGVTSLFFSIIGTFILFTESVDARERKKKMHNLVYSMQSRTTTPNGAQRGFTTPEVRHAFGQPHPTYGQSHPTYGQHEAPQHQRSMHSIQQPFFTTV